jgi:hypothetical protein
MITSCTSSVCTSTTQLTWVHPETTENYWYWITGAWHGPHHWEEDIVPQTKQIMGTQEEDFA